MDKRLRNKMTEASADKPQTQNVQHADVDSLFSKAIEHLQGAGEQLNALMTLLQKNYHGTIDSAPVAKCIEATASSHDAMGTLAAKWREEAEKAKEVNSRAGSLNTGIMNLTTGHKRKGLTIKESLEILSRKHMIESFDERPFVKDKLYFQKPKTLNELQKNITFDFDKFLAGVDE